MRIVRLIARDELRLMLRNRVALIAFALIMLLTLVAIASSWSHQRSIADLRARHQHEAEHAFDAQPDRHPHRMVHYGHFIFRPPGPLAAFDPGVDAFTGNSMFLEGHRQNTANFGDVRQSSLLLRFGQLTPAFVLQIIAPLLMIFLGFGALARETERGTLSLLMLQGASRGQVVAGKLLALGLVAAAVAAPAILGLVAIAGQPGALALPMLTIALGYLLYLGLWTVLIVFVSTMVRRSRDSLLVLVALWAVTTILLPRAVPDVAANAVPLRNRLQTDVAIARDLRRLGDSHNPDDPHFAQFKQRLLDRYKVTRVEDLPLNYKGLLAIEGERLTSGLFDRYAGESYTAQTRQNGLVDASGLLSPAIALRGLSMAAAGTDFAAHRRFLEQAEAYRYALVQRLNRMEAEAVSYADDTATDADADRRKRVAATNWQAMPDFRFVAPDGSMLARAALPGLALLAVWLAGASALLALATRRLGARR
ncbi:ABC transporter permease [Sphingomonas sp.]|jgi:ABC-2 type transport system permease protein|uniref:ABC transporter permease n=1 Tax=Sphingomonas sp. TaxID=28214 RepID=UPI0035C7A575